MFSRWAEVLIALAGIWLMLRGGWFFSMIGGITAALGLTLAVGARRRMAFRRDVDAPGMVDVVEGAIRYYGATSLGGEIALRDLTEIRLLRLKGKGYWRLRNQQAEALLIPVDAAGAVVLADAFAALPGMDMGGVSDALSHVADQVDAVRVVWRRSGQGGLT